jgi:AmiR/NasT family two-component response regulator
MRHADLTIGVLDLFGLDSERISKVDALVAQGLADMAASGVVLQRSLRYATVLSEQIQGALDTRLVIEQAKGVLAEYSHQDMDHAFKALRTYARSSHLKLGDVAAMVVARTLPPGKVLSQLKG